MSRFKRALPMALAIAFVSAPTALANDYLTQTPPLSTSKVDPIGQEWTPRNYRYSIGYETSSTGPTGNNLVDGGFWNGAFGVDLLLGYTKGADSVQTQTTENIPNLITPTSSKSVQTTLAGSKSASAITFGGRPKLRVVQNNWLQVYGGFLLGATLTGSVDYPTGTITETFADRTQTGNKTVSEFGSGTITQSTSLQVFAGPSLGSEIYLRWIPHLALGFSTGLYFVSGGTTKTTTSTGNKNYTVTNGTAASPTAQNSNTSTTEVNPGLRGSTFGLGGSTFSILNTIFTVRYVW